MSELLQREKVRFSSGRTDCAAWHYPGTNGACVVMAGGMGVNKEPGTDRFATAIPRLWVRRPRLRLQAPWGERRAAAPGRPHQRAAFRLAGST